MTMDDADLTRDAVRRRYADLAVDMTDEMLDLARGNAHEAGVDNVPTFTGPAVDTVAVWLRFTVPSVDRADQVHEPGAVRMKATGAGGVNDRVLELAVRLNETRSAPAALARCTSTKPPGTPTVRCCWSPPRDSTTSEPEVGTVVAFPPTELVPDIRSA